MLQIGFGLTPLMSGLLTMATAVGSLSTRTIVTRAIRGIGFRKLLIWASVGASFFYMFYGLFTPSTPHVLIFAVLLVGGLCNSMVMVTLNALGYSEIPKARMGHATATASMAQQLCASIGVVMGATLLEVTSLLRGGDGVHLGAGDFMPAFLAVGMMTLLSVRWFRHLSSDVGDELRHG
jgi:MFS family permease